MNDSTPRTEPLVSVCVVSYNQANYLRECLQSLVDQETDFPFEVLVGDDCSTDDSRGIIAEFARRYPAIVKPIFQEKNLGPIGNYMATHRLAAGRYVAHMDGDDLALPDKLRKQVARFEADPQMTIVWHRMRFFNEAGLREDHPRADAPYLEVPVTRADLMLYGPFGPHSSTMYRREQFSLRYAEFDAIDWLFSIELIGDGHGVMMADVLGAYRVHGLGMSGGAVANRRTRELLCGCQRELLGRFPQYRSVIALRSAFVAVFDLLHRQRYFTYSLRVFALARALPDLRQVPKLLRFHRFSRLPRSFAR
jgi:glycosyltransferase involved in cell wall biosynthesis